MNILIIEDEKELSEVLVALLTQNDYRVDAVYDGLTGEEYALTNVYDVIVLDIMLPGQNGLSLLKNIRKQRVSTPVLLLTAKSEIEDTIAGLDSGADDYLTKPFVTGELLARIRAMGRRKDKFTGDELLYKNTTLDRNTLKLSNGDKTVKLSLKEYQIIEMLMTNSKQIIPKDLFLEKIWGYDSDAEYNAIEVYISFLRKKLSAIGSTMQIKAVRGVGYSLEDGND